MMTFICISERPKVLKPSYCTKFPLPMLSQKKKKNAFRMSIKRKKERGCPIWSRLARDWGPWCSPSPVLRWWWRPWWHMTVGSFRFNSATASCMGPWRSKPVGLAVPAKPLFHACLHKYNRCTWMSPSSRANVVVFQLRNMFLANRLGQFGWRDFVFLFFLSVLLLFLPLSGQRRRVSSDQPLLLLWYTAAGKEKGISASFLWMYFSFLEHTKIHPH